MNGQTGQTPPDYFIIGHITKDQVEGGYRLGGTAVYSGVLAHRMGLKVAIYTSGASNLALDILDGIEIIDQPGPGTTTFINEYTPSGRIQRLLDRAEELDPSQIPSRWKDARIIHLAPVAREVPFSTSLQFPEGFLGYSLQGWMREWDGEGRISPSPLPELDPPAREFSVGILSLEDLGNDRSGLDRIQDQFPNLVLTLGSQGVEVYSGGRTQAVPAPPTPETDPTGAGDIFAAAFMIFWQIKGMAIEESARLANALAAASIRQSGIDGIPGKREITEIIKVHK